MDTLRNSEIQAEIEANGVATIPPTPPADPPPPQDVKIEKSAPGTLREGMAVAIMWRTIDKRTMIYPGMFKVKGVRPGGRLSLKLIKNT